MMEEKLMRSLMRAAGTARRHPHTATRTEGENNLPKGRGFGHILDILSAEGVSQQFIADTLGIRPQSVSEAVTVLENRGLVTKQPSEADKRKMLICITQQGIDHREKMAQHRRQHAQKLFAVLSEEEKTQLMQLLDKISAAYDDNGGTL